MNSTSRLALLLWHHICVLVAFSTCRPAGLDQPCPPLNAQCSKAETEYVVSKQGGCTLQAYQQAYHKDAKSCPLSCQACLSMGHMNHEPCHKLKGRLHRIKLPPTRQDSSSCIVTLSCVATASASILSLARPAPGPSGLLSLCSSKEVQTCSAENEACFQLNRSALSHLWCIAQ